MAGNIDTMKAIERVETEKGAVRLPAYLPVSTFGSEFPLDRIIRPFLRRFADCLMVSYHYARQMPGPMAMPVFVDSGGFALLSEGATVIEDGGDAGSIACQYEGEETVISPAEVLALQQRLAQWGSSLDFPIPPSLEDPAERERRMRLTIGNARWALKANDKASLRLFGSVQGWDGDSYAACAQALLDAGYRDLAIGGLVPRASDRQFVIDVARRVRAMMPEDGLLHAFGMGEVTMVRELFGAGVTSVDSSSFVRAAASGKRWDGGWSVECPSPLERAHVAIANYRTACEETGAGNRESQGRKQAAEVAPDF